MKRIVKLANGSDIEFIDTNDPPLCSLATRPIIGIDEDLILRLDAWSPTSDELQ